MSTRPKGVPSKAGADLRETQAVLQRFTLARREQQAPRQVNLNDPFAVAVLRSRGEREQQPDLSDSVAAWLCRLEARGAGRCTPTAEGLHLLVLDSRAVAELQVSMTKHRRKMASYAQLQADLARLDEIGQAD